MANANPLDEGNYGCVVENEHGSIWQDFVVKVAKRVVGHEPIIRHGQPGNHTILVGGDLELHCEIELLDAASPPMIQWVHHPTIKGSMFNEEGTLNTAVLQDCSMTGLCTISNSNETYIVDDPQVGKFYL